MAFCVRQWNCDFTFVQVLAAISVIFTASFRNIYCGTNGFRDRFRRCCQQLYVPLPLEADWSVSVRARKLLLKNYLIRFWISSTEGNYFSSLAGRSLVTRYSLIPIVLRIVLQWILRHQDVLALAQKQSNRRIILLFFIITSTAESWKFNYPTNSGLNSPVFSSITI